MLELDDQETPGMLGHICNASIVVSVNVPAIRGHVPNVDKGQHLVRICILIKGTRTVLNLENMSIYPQIIPVYHLTNLLNRICVNSYPWNLSVFVYYHTLE